MRRCDVLIVGGGPAGATCARALGNAGADVVLLDRARFPREKPCAGWVTPTVFYTLGITPADYASAGRTLQPFTAFQTSVMGSPAQTTAFPAPVSYGIVRTEFDAWLLGRTGTPVFEGTTLTSVQRQGRDWVVNDAFAAPVIVGAGGHFCPVARILRQSHRDGRTRVVLAKHMEIRLGRHDPCGISATTPELYFCDDLEGYGWAIRKGNVLNVGIGRRVGLGFRERVHEFARFLAREKKVPASVLDPRLWRGHAYALAGDGVATADGIVLIGDAAGLAAPESGEGIDPAIESGRRAADAIGADRSGTGDYTAYATWVAARTGPRGLSATLRRLAPAALGRALLRHPAFARYAVERFFLRTPNN